MKNIKKSLALLLAFVLVLGLCTIGAGATDATAFKDAGSINPAYKTAVDVMAGMGILAGSDDDGDGVYDFKPTDNVTRAQAAKIIAYMILGKTAAEKLPAKAVLDVKATDWQSKYVYYLYTKGIINGYGDGTFGSNDSVTANQFAKMLLCACGYGKVDEFTGAGWDVNVFALAVELGVYKDTETTDYDAAATREEASLYTYNTMTTVNLVSYSKDDGYVDKKTDFATSKYNFNSLTGVIQGCPATGEAYTIFLQDGKTATMNLNISADKSLIGHQVTVYYNTDDDTDTNGLVYYNAYFIKDISTVVAPGFGTNNATYKALGGTKLDFANANATNYAYASNYTCWVNYKPQDTTTNKINWATVPANDFAWLTLGLDFTGSYILNTDKKIIGYAKITYYVDKISNIVTTAGSEEIDLANGVSTDTVLSNTKTNDMVKEYDGIAKGDIVSVSYNGNIYTLTKATVAKSVTVSKLDSLGKINGTYGKTSAASNKIATGDAIVVGNTYDLYLDSANNYCYAVKVASANTNVALVTRLYKVTASSTYGGSTTKLYAQTVNVQGTETDYLVTPQQYNDLGGTITNLADATTASNTTVTRLVTVYEAVDPNNFYGTSVKVGVFTDNVKDNLSDTATLDTSLTSYNGQVFSTYTNKVGTGSNYLTSDVVYIYVNGIESNLKATVTSTKPSGTYNIYFKAEAITNSSNKSVSAVFIAAAAPEAIGTSYIYSTGSVNVNYSYKFCSITAQTAADEYWIAAYLDGKYTTDVFKLKTNSTTAPGSNLFNSYGTVYLKPGYYSYTIDSDGYYTLTAVTTNRSGTNAIVNNEAINSIYNGRLSTATTVLTDLDVSTATIVDFTGNNYKSLSDLSDAMVDHTVKVSFVANDYYNATYPTGNPNATVGTIYVTSIS